MFCSIESIRRHNILLQAQLLIGVSVGGTVTATVAVIIGGTVAVAKALK